MDSIGSISLVSAVRNEQPPAERESAERVRPLTDVVSDVAVKAPEDSAKTDTETPEQERPEPLPTKDIRLSIERRSEGHGFIYRFIDDETGEVVREYPPEDLKALASDAAARSGRSEGLLVDHDA